MNELHVVIPHLYVPQHNQLRCRHCGFVIDGTVTHYNGSTYHEICGEYVSYWKLGDTPLIKGDD